MNLDMALTAFAAAVLVISVLWALLFKKHALMRLVCVIIRAVLAFAGAIIFKLTVVSSYDNVNDLLIQLLGEDNTINELIASSPVIMDIALGLTASLLSVLAFVILYFVLGIVMFIVRIIACAILGKQSKGIGPLGRLACGFIQGFIILSVMLVPLATYADVADTLFDTAESISPSDEMATVHKPITDVNSSTVFKLHRKLGGELAAKPLTSISFKLDQKKVKTTLSTEIDAICELVSNTLPLVQTPMAEYTDAEIASLENMGTLVSKSKLTSALISEILGGASEAWDKGEAYMGIEKPSLDPTLDPLIFKTISILGSDASNTEYLKADIDTFAKIISKVISASKQNGSEGELTDALMAEGLVKDLLTEINKNPRMRPLIPTLTNVGLSLIADSIGIDENAAASYNKLTSAIASELNASANLTADERQDKMTEAINNALEELSITDIDDSEVSIIAMSVLAYFDGSENKSPSEATSDDVSAFLNEMTSAVAQQSNGSQQTPTASESASYSVITLGTSSLSPSLEAARLMKAVCDIQNDASLTREQKENKISALLNDSYLFNSEFLSEEKATELKQSLLANAERNGSDASKALKAVGGLTPNKENTVFVYTLEAILIDDDAISSDISEQAMAKLIDSIDLIFSNINDIVSSLGGESSSDTVKAICESIGAILDTLAETEELYGSQKTDTLLETLLHAKGLRDITNMNALDIRSILSSRAEKNVSYSALLKTVSETANTLSAITNSSEITSENIGALVDALTNEGAGSVIASIITPEKISDLGFNSQTEEQLKDASNLLQSVFTNISENDSAEREKDISAVTNIITIVTEANKEGTSELFGDNGSTGDTASALIDTVLESTAISNALAETELSENPFGLELSEAEKNEVSSAIQEKLSGADENTEKTLNSLAALLGISLD